MQCDERGNEWVSIKIDIYKKKKRHVIGDICNYGLFSLNSLSNL